MTKPAKHPSTDDETEWNNKCKDCIHALFNRDKAGRKILKIGKCSAKNKYLVSTLHSGTFPCELFKAGK